MLILETVTKPDVFYRCVLPDDRSIGNIKVLLEFIKSELPNLEIIEEVKDAEFHCTTMYSYKTPTKFVKKDVGKLIKSATVIGCELFGDRDDEYALVLLLDSEDLENLNKEWVRVGCENTHEKYQPHVTIAYLKFNVDLTSISKKIKERDVRLQFGKEVSDY